MIRGVRQSPLGPTRTSEDLRLSVGATELSAVTVSMIESRLTLSQTLKRPSFHGTFGVLRSLRNILLCDDGVPFRCKLDRERFVQYRTVYLHPSEISVSRFRSSTPPRPTQTPLVHQKVSTISSLTFDPTSSVPSFPLSDYRSLRVQQKSQT